MGARNQSKLCSQWRENGQLTLLLTVQYILSIAIITATLSNQECRTSPDTQ